MFEKHKDISMTEANEVKKRWTAMVLAGWMALMSMPVQAQENYVMQGRMASDMPEMTFTITDTGMRMTDVEREKMLSVTIEAPETGFSQTMTYASSIVPNSAYVARLEDFNFDGYQDLALCVGLGYNEYDIMALWNAENGCFDAPYQALELSNYRLFPEKRAIFTCEKDGAVNDWMALYCWEGTAADTLTLAAQGGAYDTGDPDTIGERLTWIGTQVWHCWDMRYDADWYTQERVLRERDEVLYGCIMGGLIHENPRFARVANVSWVNLRKEDRKSSPSLAKLNVGTEVWVLAEGCGEDGGWVRVMTDMEGEDGLFTSQTGYIWHSYLEME